MKNILILLCLALLLSSCEEVVYPEPQPPHVKALKEIPGRLQGVYLDENMDTLFVRKQSFSYTSGERISLGEEFLSDSVVLKPYKDKYFFSTSVIVGDETYWLSYLLDPEEISGNIDVYTMSAKDMVRMAMLQEITSKVADLESGSNKYYLFAPKKRHYRKIIRDTVFSKFTTFTKVGGN